jgi:hypothetical protein
MRWKKLNNEGLHFTYFSQGEKARELRGWNVQHK